VFYETVSLKMILLKNVEPHSNFKLHFCYNEKLFITNSKQLSKYLVCYFHAFFRKIQEFEQFTCFVFRYRNLKNVIEAEINNEHFWTLYTTVKARIYCYTQGPSLLKNFGETNLIVCVSVTSQCSLDRSTTFL